MPTPNPKVDGFIRKNKTWQPLLDKLRAILLDSPLTEDLKWRTPCYTFEDHNIVIVAVLKNYVAFSFIKGALLKDPQRLLDLPGENTQSARVIRITSPDQITQLEPHLKAYILEAIEIEKSGLKVPLKKITERPIPDELQQQFDKNPQLKSAFHSLTPGRQRGYLLHFSSAKQSTTRTSRIEKCIPKILQGKGFMDD